MIDEGCALVCDSKIQHEMGLLLLKRKPLLMVTLERDQSAASDPMMSPIYINLRTSIQGVVMGLSSYS